MKWITIKLLSQLTGYSEDAIRCKIKKGVWLQGSHWVKGPDGRILINLPGVNAWIESRRA